MPFKQHIPPFIADTNYNTCSLQFVPLRLGEAPIDQHVESAKPQELKPSRCLSDLRFTKLTSYFSKDECFALSEELLPPAHFIADLTRATKLAATDAAQCQDILGTILATLLDAAFDNFRHLASEGAQSVPQRMGQMHYNLVMTSKWLMLVPYVQFLFFNSSKASSP